MLVRAADQLKPKVSAILPPRSEPRIVALTDSVDLLWLQDRQLCDHRPTHSHRDQAAVTVRARQMPSEQQRRSGEFKGAHAGEIQISCRRQHAAGRFRRDRFPPCRILEFDVDQEKRDPRRDPLHVRLEAKQGFSEFLDELAEWLGVQMGHVDEELEKRAVDVAQRGADVERTCDTAWMSMFRKENHSCEQ